MKLTRQLALAVSLTASTTSALAQTNCLLDIAQEKTALAADIAQAFRDSGNPILLGSAWAIDDDCEELKARDLSRTAFDSCFNATRNAFQLTDLRPTEFDERWEAIANRYNQYRDHGFCGFRYDTI